MPSPKITFPNSMLLEVSLVAVLTAVMISLLVPAMNNVAESSMNQQYLASASNQSHFVSKNKSVPHRIARSQFGRM